jgi:endonuclease/exonuclease/phosphatase family metal-dependent hydrolase
MKLIGKLLAYPLLAVNIVAALLLIFSCYGSILAPIGKWPFASLSGLAFPFLYLLNFMFLILWLLTWKKGALVPLATILICLIPTLRYFPLHLSKSRNVNEPYITVISYNTEGFGIDDNKDWNLSNPVLNYTIGLDADIIFLQEATRHVLDLASRDKMKTNIYPYIGLPNDKNGEACMSKYPILLNESIDFENTVNSCQYLRILIGTDTLAIYNCHLQSNHLAAEEISEYQKFIKNPTDSTHYKASKKVLKNLLKSTEQRAGQARMIADRARKETSKYMIVCGDFNDTPLSYSHRLFNRFMRDAYAQSGVGMGITYHEHKLYYRIDHIFCSKNITPLHTWIDRTQKDSDHYPVISKIRLE